MKQHEWREKVFTDGGTYYGYKTCLATWGCKSCNLEIELPLGMHPNDYVKEDCQGVTNETTNNGVHVRGLQKNYGLPPRNGDGYNKHGLRNLPV